MEDKTLVNEICPTQTIKLLNDGALLLDIREDHEIKELAYNVANILHIPLGNISENLSLVPENIQIIVACRSGKRSLTAATFLKNNGYSKILNLKGGIIGWTQEGFPTNGDANNFLSAIPESLKVIEPCKCGCQS